MARTINMRRTGGGRDNSYSAAPSTAELDSLAHWLDSKFSLFGIRFGMDSVLGLVPGVGDAAGLALSAYLIGQGYRMGARKRTIARMAANALGDTVVGSIPVLGSVIDVFWKANRANMKLLRRDLERANPVRRF
ncbi:MAG: DUF4112 domain-containing protein [Pseudomonadota bacterium]